MAGVYWFFVKNDDFTSKVLTWEAKIYYNLFTLGVLRREKTVRYPVFDGKSVDNYTRRLPIGNRAPLQESQIFYIRRDIWNKLWKSH